MQLMSRTWRCNICPINRIFTKRSLICILLPWVFELVVPMWFLRVSIIIPFPFCHSFPFTFLSSTLDSDLVEITNLTFFTVACSVPSIRLDLSRHSMSSYKWVNEWLNGQRPEPPPTYPEEGPGLQPSSGDISSVGDNAFCLPWKCWCLSWSLFLMRVLY